MSKPPAKITNDSLKAMGSEEREKQRYLIDCLRIALFGYRPLYASEDEAEKKKEALKRAAIEDRKRNDYYSMGDGYDPV